MNHELTPEDAALLSSETAKKVQRETGHNGIETATVVGMSQSKGNVPYVVISVAAGRPGGSVLTVPSKTGQQFYPGQRVSIEWDPPAGCYVTGSIDLQPVPRARASLLCGGGSEEVWTITTLNLDPEPGNDPSWSPELVTFSGVSEVYTFSESHTILSFESTGGFSAEGIPSIELYLNGFEINTIDLYDPLVPLSTPVSLGDEIFFGVTASPGDLIGGRITLSGSPLDQLLPWAPSP